jgi:hypothetical protein
MAAVPDVVAAVDDDDAFAGGGGMRDAPTGSLGSTLEGLRTLVHKRKTAWTYLKNAADGRVYWLWLRSLMWWQQSTTTTHSPEEAA